MNSAEIGEVSPASLPPFAQLLLAYAPSGARPWQALCWALDQRLAGVVRRGVEPTIAAIRLAWWDEVLVARNPGKGGGEPLVERWRAMAMEGAEAATERLIDGWRILVAPEELGEEDLRSYAGKRGGGLFTLLAAGAHTEQAAAIEHAGALWALWDLAGHVRDEALARRALETGHMLANEASHELIGSKVKPLRLARSVALPDIQALRLPREGFSLRHYGRLLRASLRG